MKSIFTKIEFHYSFLIIALGLVLTGHFSNLCVFTFLIIVHELGHTITAKSFKYKIFKIIIYPYGGITKLDTMVNTSIWKDLVVAISGTLMQCLCFFAVYLLYSNGMVREYIYNLFYLYHKSMLIFNLLPIIPLDGFKIFNLIMCKFLNFKLSNNISVFISLIVIVVFLLSNIYDKNYSIVLVIGVLMHNIYNFYNQTDYVYYRFMLERYLYDFSYKKKRLIDDKNKMYKNNSHLIMKNNKIVTEKDFLCDFFSKN